MTYYFDGSDSNHPGEVGIVHGDRDCDELSDATMVKPVSNPPERVAYCACAGGSQTCDVVKSDNEVCGRELPCQYHS